MRNVGSAWAWAVGILLALLTAASFTLSFDAVRATATGAGINIGWLYALMIDAGIIVFSITRLYCELNRMKWTGLACLLMVLALVGISAALNVGTNSYGWFEAGIHALPPLVLALAFEIGLVSMIRNEMHKFASVAHIDRLKAEMSELEEQKGAISAEIQSLSEEREEADAKYRQALERLENANFTESMASLNGRKRDVVLALTASLEPLTSRQLGEQLGLSPNKLYNSLSQLMEEGLIGKDDNRAYYLLQ